MCGRVRGSLAVVIVLLVLGVALASAASEVKELHENIKFETTACMWDRNANPSSERQFMFSLLPKLDLSDFISNANVMSYKAPYASWMVDILRFNGYPSVVKLGANWSSTIDGFIELGGRADAGGDVHVVYPVDVTLTYPGAETFSRGEVVRLGAAAFPRDGAVMETGALVSDLGLTGSAEFGYDLSGTVSLGTNELPLIGKHSPVKPFPNLELFPNKLVWNYNPIEERWEQLSRTLANFAPLGVYGYIGYPTVRWRTDGTDFDGSLRVDTSKTFAYVEIDALSFIDTKIPLSFTTDEVAGCKLDYSIIGATITMAVEAEQRVTFQPRLSVRYEFSDSLLVNGELSDHVTVYAGPLAETGSVPPEVIVPSNVGGPVTVTPVIILGNEFSNSYGVQSTHELSAEALKYNLKIPGLDPIKRWTYLNKCWEEYKRVWKWSKCWDWCWCCGAWLCSDCVWCWDWEGCLKSVLKRFISCSGARFAPWNIRDRKIELGPVITGGYAPTPAPEDRLTEAFELRGFEEKRLNSFLLAPGPWSGALTMLCSHVVNEPVSKLPIEYSIFGPPTNCERLELAWTDSSDWTPTGIATVGGDYFKEALSPADGSWWLHVAPIDAEGNVGTLFHYGPIIIDRTPPNVAVESAAEWLEEPVEFRVASDEPLRGLTEESLSLTGGTIVSFEPAPDATRFLVRVRPYGTGEITLALSAVDWAGNRTDDIQRTVSFIDVLPPKLPLLWSPSHTVDVWSRTPDVAIEFTSTDDVSGVAGYEIVWTQASEWVPSHTITHAVEFWPRGVFLASEDEAWYLYLAVVDGAGNWSEASSIGPFLIDTTPPEANVTSPHDEWTESPIEFNITYSETARDLDRRYVQIDAGSVAEVQRTSPRSFRVLVNPFESGDVTLYDSGGVFDRAGNPSPSAFATVRFTDIMPPAPPVLSSPTHEIGVVSNNPDVVIEAHGATDDLSGIAGYEVVWDKAESWYPAYTASAGPLWAGGTYFTPLGEDASWFLHVMSVDESGNWSAPVACGPFLLDTEPPVVDITADPLERMTVDEPVRFRISFSEAVTGFSVEDLEFDNATVSDWEEESETEYAFVAHPDSSVSVVLRVPEGVVEDEAGNPNDASDWIEVPCFAAPRISEVYLSTSNPSGQYAKPGDRVTLDFRIERSGDLDHMEVIIGGCTADLAASSEQEYVGALGVTATCGSMPETTPDGTLAFHIEVVNRTGLLAVAERTTDGQGLLFDKTPPHPDVVGTPPSHSNDEITFRISFDEPVSELDRASLRVEGGSVLNVTRADERGFQARVVPEEGADVSLRLDSGAVTDLAGNLSAPSDALTVPYITELSDVSISTSNPTREYCTIGDTVTVAFTAGAALKGMPEVEIGGCPSATVTYHGSNEYVATCEMGASTREGEIDFLIAFEDARGNKGSADRTTDGSYIVFDSEPPGFSNCPNDIETPASTVYWDEPIAWDNGSGVASLAQTHHSGDIFAVGTTTVIYTASDRAGQTATCEFDIVVSSAPPTLVVELASWETDPTSDWEIDFIAESSEDVWGSSPPPNSCCGGDLNEFDVDVSGSAGATDGCVWVTCQMTEFQIHVCGMTQTGSVIVTIPAGAVVDADGNPNKKSNTVEIWYVHTP